MTEIGKERGWHKMTRESFDAQRGPRGALLVGNPDVVEKIIRHSKALGGISRITFIICKTTFSTICTSCPPFTGAFWLIYNYCFRHLNTRSW
jgi:hypothetical protein